MTKEIDALKSYDKIDNTLCLNNNRCNIEFAISEDENLDCKNAYEMTKCLDDIRQALTELQAIKNAKPSDAMECVNRIWDDIDVCNNFRQSFKDLKTIENYILKAQEQEKVLNIIIKKNVRIYWIKSYSSVGGYNSGLLPSEQLAQEEFSTLKEWSK